MRLLLFCTLALCACQPVLLAQPFYFTGGVDNDFYNESNWTSNPDGTGSSPAINSINPGNNAIVLNIDLIIDGDSVVANGGRLDFTAGSLTLEAGSTLVTDDVLDVDPGATSFSANGSVITLGGGLFLGGQATTIIGSTVTVGTAAPWDLELQDANTIIEGSTFSVSDDIDFGASFTIIGSSFTSADNTWVDSASPTFIDTVVSVGNRLGLQNGSFPTLLGSSTLDLVSGGGLLTIEDVFTGDPSQNTLLAGGSSEVFLSALIEDRDLELTDSASAVFSSSQAIDVAGGSEVVVSSMLASVTFPAQLGDGLAGSVFNGLTGLSYAADPSAWNVSDWDGLSAVTLQLVPEPTSLSSLGVAALLLLGRKRRRFA